MSLRDVVSVHRIDVELFNWINDIFDLPVAHYEKPEDLQSHQDSSSGDHVKPRDGGRDISVSTNRWSYRLYDCHYNPQSHAVQLKLKRKETHPCFIVVIKSAFLTVAIKGQLCLITCPIWVLFSANILQQKQYSHQFIAEIQELCDVDKTKSDRHNNEESESQTDC